VTLSNQHVIDRLGRNFVAAWGNINGKKDYAGTSNTNLPTQAAKEVTNCAGHHNAQMVFLTSDGRVLHCLPGFWNAQYLLQEMDLAVQLGKLYYKRGLSSAERNREYLDLHLRHALDHSVALRYASQHQGFDKMNLEKRALSDFHRKKGFVTAGLKTPDQVLHERLAERPFLPFESFDVKRFVDMGRKQYKYDYGVPGKGKT